MAGHREDLHLTPYFVSDRIVLALLSNRATMRIVRQNLCSLLDTDEHLAFLLQTIARYFGSAIETGWLQVLNLTEASCPARIEGVGRRSASATALIRATKRSDDV
jgi:hypothetical protein